MSAKRKQMQEQEFDAFRDDYQRQINSAISYTGQSHDFYTRVKADYLLEALASEFGTDKPIKVLDVGCGHGDIHRHVTKTEVPVSLTGIDVAATVVEEARKMHPDVDYDVYDGVKLPYEDGQFDAAYTICVMHHVPPPQWAAFLAEMRRVVRKGGLVMVFEHNPFNPLTRHLVNNCPIDENAVLLKSKKLLGLMGETGLSSIRSRFIIFTPIDTAFFKRFDRLIGWLPLGAQYYTIGKVPAG